MNICLSGLINGFKGILMFLKQFQFPDSRTQRVPMFIAPNAINNTFDPVGVAPHPTHCLSINMKSHWDYFQCTEGISFLFKPFQFPDSRTQRVQMFIAPNAINNTFDPNGVAPQTTHHFSINMLSLWDKNQINPTWPKK